MKTKELLKEQEPVLTLEPKSGSTSLRTRIAKQLVRLVSQRVPVDVVLPDGSLMNFAGARRSGLPAMDLSRPEEFFARLAEHPKLGIGEGYTAGDWSAADGTDLAELLVPFAERMTDFLPSWLMRMRRLVDRPIPRDQLGSAEHVQQNIAAHYDLSNEMFAAFLDPSLSYSSAMFDPALDIAEQSLEAAQLRKVNSALDLAGVGFGSEVLEIGTGWGTLAIEAARRGARVKTVTLSEEQADLARARIEEAGFGDRVSVLIQDYRDVAGEYDAILSIEMIEAVGERYWPDYFKAIARLLRPGGRASIQAILMSHDRYLQTRNSYGWIQKHIFPGGLIPSAEAIADNSNSAGLVVDSSHRFGLDYAETLNRWRASFNAAWPQIESEQFGEEFRRTWEFYLAYCEAGFRTGYLDVAQISLHKSSNPVR